MYRTTHINISKTSYLYPYMDEMTYHVAKLYNRANFIVRQFYTAMKAFEQMKLLHENQLKIIHLVHDNLAGTKYFPKGKWLSYYSLDYLLKVTKDPAYYNLPAQVNQQTLKSLYRDYKAFFEALKSYNLHPELFKSKPKLPHYTDHSKTAVFTDQVVHVKKNSLGFPVLKFPLTKETLRITAVPSDCRVKEVRVTPVHNKFKLGIVYEIPDKGIEIKKDSEILRRLKKLKTLDDLRVLSIDPGVDNLCSITNNFGENPVLLKGQVLKSVNQFYNKQKAAYQSISYVCNQRYMTERIRQITSKRNNRMLDLLHKTSHMITEYAVKHHVNVVIMGHNVFQKQEISIGHVNNQNFVQIPFSVLTGMLRYKLAEAGITFVLTEESYTSKADFLAGDAIPVYSKEKAGTYTFSGERIKRGLYRHGDGTITNADINGSANILRKVFPKVSQWDRGIVDMPCTVVRISA